MRRIPFEIWLVALVLVINLYPLFVPANSLVMGWFGSDDAFYYFKTAQNIAEGRGITFDGLGRDSGFHPLWMLVITPIFALARFDRVLPLRLVVIVSVLLSAGTGVLLYRLAKRALAPLAAAFAALFWVFYPYVHKTITQMGMESAISAFFILLLIYRVARQAGANAGLIPSADELAPTRAILRPALVTGAVAALAVFARLDNIFLVLLVGLWYCLRPARMRYMLLGDVALIALGVLWSYMERVGFGARFAQNSTAVYWMVVLALGIRILLYYVAGLYEAPGEGWKRQGLYLARAGIVSLLATVLLSGAMLGLQMLRVFPGFPRLTLAYEAGFGLASVLAVRLVMLLLERFAASADAPLPSPAARVSEESINSRKTAARDGSERFSVEQRSVEQRSQPTRLASRFLRRWLINGNLNEPLRWRPTLLRMAGFYAPLIFSLAAYMIGSQAYFGTPMPVSGQIKRWWGTLPNPVYGHPVDSLKGMLGFTAKGSPWELVSNLTPWPAVLPSWLRLLVYGGIVLALLILLWKRSRSSIHLLALFPLFVGGIVQLISYTGTGYLHMRSWYWTVSLLVVTLLLGILLDNFLCLAERPPVRSTALARYARPLALILCALVVLYGAEEIVRRMPMQLSKRMQGYYLESIHELEASTEPGALIGSTGGGVIAYFIEDRTVVNMDGLMNTTEYFHLLQQGKASQYLDRIGLDYVSASFLVITDSDPYFQFKDRLARIKVFGGATLFKWE